MKLRPGTPLNVSLRFAPDNVVHVGRIALDRGIAFLEYSEAFRGSGLTLNPRLQAPGTELVKAAQPRLFAGLHGVFADSLPDSWGERLIQRRATRHGIDYHTFTALDKLSIVGERGMGALVYAPAFEAEEPQAVDLDLLAEASNELLAGRDTDVVDELERLGGSSGGTRPKVLVASDSGNRMIEGTRDIPAGYSHWLVKFRSSGHDVEDIGPLEAAYADMAREAGLDVPPTRLIPSNRHPHGYFAVRRFDRPTHNTRLHVLSLAALAEVNWQEPSLDYDAFARFTRYVTRHEPDVEAVLARMVFNVLARNRDDHAKQHAFTMGHEGKWRLAPAYDLTFSRGPGNEHYFAVNGKGSDIGYDDLAKVAEVQSVSRRKFSEIVERASTAVARFGEFAAQYEVTNETVRLIKPALEAQLRALRPATISPPARKASRRKR